MQGPGRQEELHPSAGCRYFSGFLAWHPLLRGLDYYWRMEPDVHYYCDLDYDPFAFMQARRRSSHCTCNASPCFGCM